MKQEPICWIDPRTGIRFVGIMPLGYRVAPGLNPIDQTQRPGYKKFEPTEKPRAPFAGKKR